MASVVITKLPKGDYELHCVVLPANYGTSDWDELPEVRAIREAVFSSLHELDRRTAIAERLAARRVLIKPNLVLVYHELGTSRRSSPQTTDPRVLDATVLWLARRAAEIAIVESSGRGYPTRCAFEITGIDRLARHRGCKLVALEETPSDRYLLPKAHAHREILVPRIFSGVVRGEAAYVSVPKLKTNLYTQVTLGFKNAMGVIPYNLRQRHHHYMLDRKLVEMLYLFKPDLTLIDGVVGGEGECPAQVDPVDSRFIIAGDHPVETDRVATQLMGIDPDQVPLLTIADELGFGGRAEVEIIGPREPVSFRPADASLYSQRVRSGFPNLLFLLGLERSCRGGCIPTVRFGLAMLEAEGISVDGPATIVIGPGIREPDDNLYWVDGNGNRYDHRAIAELPGKTALIGSCGAALKDIADFFVPGCMPLPNAPHALLHRLAGRGCKVLSPANDNLRLLLRCTLTSRKIRRKLLQKGEHLDVPPPLRDPCDGERTQADEPAISPESFEPDWVAWPLPPLTREEQKILLTQEDESTIASLRGVLDAGIGFKLARKLLSWALGVIPTGSRIDLLQD